MPKLGRPCGSSICWRQTLGKLINDKKSGVVPSVFVFGARIAETKDGSDWGHRSKGLSLSRFSSGIFRCGGSSRGIVFIRLDGSQLSDDSDDNIIRQHSGHAFWQHDASHVERLTKADLGDVTLE